MPTLKEILSKQTLARYRLPITYFLLGFAILGIYGYIFPTKYYFSCFGDTHSTASEATYDITSDSFTNIELLATIPNQEIVIKGYYWGFLYSLDEHKISECTTKDEVVTCKKGSINNAYVKPQSEMPYLSTSFDILRSQLDKHWLVFKIRKGQVTDYDFTNLRCEKRSKAF